MEVSMTCYFVYRYVKSHHIRCIFNTEDNVWGVFSLVNAYVPSN